MNHHMDDRHIGEFVSMPEDFGEAMASNFDFPFSYEEAEKKLKEYGFTPLPKVKGDDNPCWSGLISQCFTLRQNMEEKSWRVSMHADTPEIKKVIEEVMANEWPWEKKGHRPKHIDVPKEYVFNSLEEYEKTMTDLAKKLRCVIQWYDRYFSGSYACMMKKKVWDNLPLFPKEMMASQ